MAEDSATVKDFVTRGSDVLSGSSIEDIIYESKERQRRFQSLLPRDETRLRLHSTQSVIDLGAGSGLTGTIGLVNFLDKRSDVQITAVDADVYDPVLLEKSKRLKNTKKHNEKIN